MRSQTEKSRTRSSPRSAAGAFISPIRHAGTAKLLAERLRGIGDHQLGPRRDARPRGGQPGRDHRDLPDHRRRHRPARTPRTRKLRRGRAEDRCSKRSDVPPKPARRRIDRGFDRDRQARLRSHARRRARAGRGRGRARAAVPFTPTAWAEAAARPAISTIPSAACRRSRPWAPTRRILPAFSTSTPPPRWSARQAVQPGDGLRRPATVDQPPPRGVKPSASAA